MIAFVLCQKRQIKQHNRHTPGFAGLLAHRQAGFIGPPRPAIVAGVPGKFANDVKRMCHPRQMFQCPEQRQRFPRQIHGLSLFRSRRRQMQQRPGSA